MGRVRTLGVLLGVLALERPSAARDVELRHLTIFADRDDDDDDGVADALAAQPRDAAANDVVVPEGVAGLHPIESDVVRVTAALARGRSLPGLQGLRAGHAVVE